MTRSFKLLVAGCSLLAGPMVLVAFTFETQMVLVRDGVQLAAGVRREPESERRRCGPCTTRAEP